MRWAGLGVLGALVTVRLAAAHPPEPPAHPPPDPPRPAVVEAPLLAPERLPVSIERIKRRLAALPPREGEALRLHFYVEVVGRAPTVDLLAGFDVRHGPVPFSPPTHQDILDIVTPREFRSPPVDLMTPLQALFDWLRRQHGKPDER